MKMLLPVLVGNGTLFIFAYYVSPKYLATYSFAGITLCALYVSFGMIKTKREGLEW